MNCSGCGAPVMKGAQFCTKCGNPVEQSSESTVESEPTYCPKCGARNSSTAVRCVSCGSPVGATAQVTAAVGQAAGVARELVSQATALAKSDRARSNPWVVGLVQAGIALAIGILLSIAVRGALVSAVTAGITQKDSGSWAAAGVSLQVSAETLVPPARHLFLFAQGALYRMSLAGQAQGGMGQAEGAIALRQPFSLLLLVPIFAIMLGGFIGGRYAREASPGDAAVAALRAVPPYVVGCSFFSIAAHVLATKIGGVTVQATYSLDLITVVFGALALGAVFFPTGAALSVGGLAGVRLGWRAIGERLPGFRAPVRAVWRTLLWLGVPAMLAAVAWVFGGRVLAQGAGSNPLFSPSLIIAAPPSVFGAFFGSIARIAWYKDTIVAPLRWLTTIVFCLPPFVVTFFRTRSLVKRGSADGGPVPLWGRMAAAAVGIVSVWVFFTSAEYAAGIDVTALGAFGVSSRAAVALGADLVPTVLAAALTVASAAYLGEQSVGRARVSAAPQTATVGMGSSAGQPGTAVVSPVAVAQVTDGSAHGYCVSCGARHEMGDAFCKECGTSVA